jgi:hypothetical protein
MLKENLSIKCPMFFILALFSYPLSCFSGIGDGGLIKLTPPSLSSLSSFEEGKPSFPDSTPLKKKKIDYRELPDVLVSTIYDFLSRKDLENAGKVCKLHLIPDDYFRLTKARIYLRSKEPSSEDIKPLLAGYMNRDKAPSFKMLPSPRIHSIEIEDYEVTSEILKMITESFPNVKSLILHKAKELKDEDLEILSSYPQLTHLALMGDDTSFTDRGLACIIAKHPHLTHLELRVSGGYIFTDAGLRALKDLKSLTHLILYGYSEFTDEGLKALKDLKTLTHLELSGNTFFTDEGLTTLKSLTGLTHLVLNGDNTFTDEGLSAFIVDPINWTGY